jgi:hypothetical protein
LKDKPWFISKLGPQKVSFISLDGFLLIPMISIYLKSLSFLKAQAGILPTIPTGKPFTDFNWGFSSLCLFCNRFLD